MEVQLMTFDTKYPALTTKKNKMLTKDYLTKRFRQKKKKGLNPNKRASLDKGAC